MCTVCVVQVPPHVHASVCYRRFVGTSAEDTPGWRAGLQAPRLHPDAFPRPERSVRLSPRATKSGGGNTTPSRAATPSEGAAVDAEYPRIRSVTPSKSNSALATRALPPPSPLPTGTQPSLAVIEYAAVKPSIYS